jgi:hypothetical protein
MAETESDFIMTVNRLRLQPYLEFEKRKLVLETFFNDITNAKLILKLLTSGDE